MCHGQFKTNKDIRSKNGEHRKNVQPYQRSKTKASFRDYDE
jgi:hypothetical protein